MTSSMNHVDSGSFSIISGNVSFLSCDLGASTASLFLWLLHCRLFLLGLHIFYVSHRLVTCSYLYALAPPFVNHAELTERKGGRQRHISFTDRPFKQ
jgi:hypothetical protein